MDRWEKYFKQGQPYLDRVIVRVIKDPISQMAALRAGEIDFIASFSPEHVNTLKQQYPQAVVMSGKETTPMTAMMKVTVPCNGEPMSKERCPHPIFGDIKVRQAVGCYGINRQEIVEIAFRGQATPWLGMIPPGTIDTVDVNHLCPYDPEKAKAVLAEAGYGPNKPLTFEILTDTEKSVFNAIATVIKEQMSRMGVTANIKLVDKVSCTNTIELISIYGMLGLRRKEATPMGNLQVADLQTRPTEVLDLTSLTVDEFRQLVPPFEAAFQGHMAHWRLDGRPRTARR
jgi:peptide/nickel transport system substrate-binding protein